MTLDGIMFDHFFFSPFTVTVGFFRAKASVRPHIFDDVVMNEVVKGEVLEFIGLGNTNIWIVLCELRQYWSYFVVV